ncbi:MAG: hypothetical protein ABWZ98_15640, partial [Nakamurella sp.]
DPDQPAAEIQVAAYVDGAGIGWFGTGQPRADVNSAYGINGNHGFYFAIPVAAGTHTVQVYAINVGGGTGNPLFGGGSATIGANPISSLDFVAAVPDSKVRVRGWAFDPDEPATALQIAVYEDNVGIGWVPSGQPRPDVNSAYGITGNHGFDFLIDSPPGDHSIQVYAINVGGGTGNPMVGTGQVRVGIPMGSLDRVVANGRRVSVQGWAFDPDQPNTAIAVAVYRDSVLLGWFPTGDPRSDINSVFGIGGNHGFNITIDSPPGRHEIHVYAINVGPSSGNPLVGSRTVDVP